MPPDEPVCPCPLTRTVPAPTRIPPRSQRWRWGSCGWSVNLTRAALPTALRAAADVQREASALNATVADPARLAGLALAAALAGSGLLVRPGELAGLVRDFEDVAARSDVEHLQAARSRRLRLSQLLPPQREPCLGPLVTLTETGHLTVYDTEPVARAAAVAAFNASHGDADGDGADDWGHRLWHEAHGLLLWAGAAPGREWDAGSSAAHEVWPAARGPRLFNVTAGARSCPATPHRATQRPNALPDRRLHVTLP